ncbi:proline-rich receptor-like protein kinase PERK4 [Rosa sericea]
MANDSDSPSPDSSPSPPTSSDSSSSSSSSPAPSKESPKNSKDSPSPTPSPPKNSSPPPSSPPPSSPPPSSPPPSTPPPKDDDDQSTESPKQNSSPAPPKDNTQPAPATPATPATPAGSNTPPKPKAPGVPATTVYAPPPPRAKNSTSNAVTPPPPSNDSSDDSSGNDSDKGVVVGVGIGAGVIVLLLLVICVLCFRRKRRKNDHMQYYGDPLKGGGHDYYNTTQQHNWNMNTQPQGDHVVRLNQAAAGSNRGGGAWPSPPPPMPMSGEMTGNFSGSHGPPLPPPSPNMSLGGFNQNTFTYDDLATATNGFSQANLLGQGGFGFVHKGVLPSGKEVAVKSLKVGSGQGEREFAAEVEIISRVHHRHLVSLVGYCISGGHRLLVYEFVANSTMEHHLHGNGLPPMDWASRLRIATGSAKGLAYLHEDCHPKIIHRDIKSANILLDNNYEAMVADFGLAKLSSDNYTHVSTRVMGTFGYLAPEYASSGKLTEKSDVFSFGVMLLELITGKRPVDPSNAMEDSLVDWARPLLTRALEDGNYTELVDIRLDNTYNGQEMARMVACAAASIRHSAKRRPKMSQIVRALEGDVSLDDLNEGVKPGQTVMMNPAAGGTSGYNTEAYNADMKKFRKLALSSQTSSEFGTNSSDSTEMTIPANPKPPPKF